MRILNRRASANINITPLVDVLLILVVVLLLAMPLFVKRLPVSLPETAITGAPTVVKAFSVVIKEDGTLQMDGNPASLESIQRKITPETTIELAIDKHVTYDRIAAVLSKIQESKPADIALITL
jgi:biopolymer transport protein ExbD